MSTITNITVGHMTNEVHVQFHTSVMMLVERLAPKFPVALHEQYKKALDNEKEALLIITKSEMTVQIADQDKVRDDVFRGFSNTVKGCRNHFDPGMRVPANLLWNVFLHYGDLTRKSLDAQTAATEDLLREFERDDLKKAIEHLNLNDWCTKLDEENRKVQQLMMDRYTEKAGQTTLRMKTARVETDKFYRAITADLHYQTLIGNSDAALAELTGELNAIVKRYKDILAQQFGKKNKVKGDGVE